MVEEVESYIMADVLGFCSCGSPDVIVDGLRRYLELVEKGDYLKDENLLVYAYISDREGLTYHGTSVYGAWITEKGKRILRILRGEEKWK